MTADASRPWRIALAIAGSAWSLFLLPPQAVAWIESGTPLWLARANGWAIYDSVRELLRAAGTSDVYLVFGSAAGLSFLAIGLALLPDLAHAGWPAAALAWVTIAGAAITPLSYLNHAQTAPLHGLWGTEFYVLAAIGLLGLASAFTTGRFGWRPPARLLLGLTPVVLAGAVLVFAYWPHGPLIAFGVEAAALIAAAPRRGASPSAGAGTLTRRRRPARSSRAAR